MKLEQLIRDNVKRIRRDPWNEYSHLELTFVEANGSRLLSAHAKLWDITTGIFEGQPATVLLLQLPQDDKWEAWTITPHMRAMHPSLDWSKFDCAVREA